tara:strand:+ start:1176 stop:2174 length:999 start_codon:yes stop_codon:yes gene_type:complete
MNQNRRKFIKNIFKSSAAISLSSPLLNNDLFANYVSNKLKISLQCFSFASEFYKGNFNLSNFSKIVRETYNLDGAEFWSIPFMGKEKNSNFLNELRQKSNDYGVKNTIILVDLLDMQTMKQGNSLASIDKKERNQAIEDHKPWIDAAKSIGCDSIRINLWSDASMEEVMKVSIESISKLLEYASDKNISIVIENHGGHTGDAKWLVNLIKKINNKKLGTLPDFGTLNFCVKRDLNLDFTAKCFSQYDKYLGVKELLPYAKGISAKSTQFDLKGNETDTNFKKMVRLIKKSNFEGYISIEYEGAIRDTFSQQNNHLPTHDGILATKKLLEKHI